MPIRKSGANARNRSFLFHHLSHETRIPSRRPGRCVRGVNNLQKPLTSCVHSRDGYDYGMVAARKTRRNHHIDLVQSWPNAAGKPDVGRYAPDAYRYTIPAGVRSPMSNFGSDPSSSEPESRAVQFDDVCRLHSYASAQYPAIGRSHCGYVVRLHEEAWYGRLRFRGDLP